MPELPDITVYVEALKARVQGEVLEKVRLANPFLLRTAVPPINEVEGRIVEDVRRQGKQIVIEMQGQIYLVLHLMIAGRLHWKPQKTASIPRKGGLAAFDFSSGTLVLTEAGSKRRAMLSVGAGAEALASFDRGGLEVLEASLEDFLTRLRSERHTLKRALTDPNLFSGIGGAYGDEILHAARLSPVALTSSLDEEKIERLYEAVRSVLDEWVERLRQETGTGFPEKVTAFRKDMRVHGRYRLPCPVCGTEVQRIVHGENETNYCPTCQTEGKLLADRALSRLLRSDWPRSIDELEQRRARSLPAFPHE